jgi:hypothetical protein
MTPPTVIDIPHTLGREEAKRRMTTRIGELPAHIPGGVAEVRSSWPGEYQMALEVAAMGQHLSATLDVQDRSIRVRLILPPMLSFMADAITTAVRDQGSQLLLGV